MVLVVFVFLDYHVLNGVSYKTGTPSAQSFTRVTPGQKKEAPKDKSSTSKPTSNAPKKKVSAGAGAGAASAAAITDRPFFQVLELSGAHSPGFVGMFERSSKLKQMIASMQHKLDVEKQLDLAEDILQVAS